MKQIIPSLQTLYQNLLQSATSAPPATLNVYKGYVQALERHGAARISRPLGRADDPRAQEEAKRIKREAEAHKQRRKIVSLLRDAGVPGPQRNMGRVLEVLSNAGVFESGGVVLVGTAAFIIYSAMLGVVLPDQYAFTEDVDLSVAPLAIAHAPNVDLLKVLRRADESFEPMLDASSPNLPPAKFRAADGFLVETLTNVRRDNGSPVPVPQLSASAEALRYQEYLVDRPARAVALYGSGVPVLVPPPSRYAVHKLMIASLRGEGASAKRQKDLQQANAIRGALCSYYPDAWGDALEDALGRGRTWRKLIESSLRMLDR